MSQKLTGNLSGLKVSETKALERLFRRRLARNELVTVELARELCELSTTLSRKIGLLVGRDGQVLEVAVGSKTLLYLPDLGRYRLGEGRLRRIRLIYTELRDIESTSKDGSGCPVISQDIYTDLEKLRLDAVVAISTQKKRMLATFAHLIPAAPGTAKHERLVETQPVPDIGRLELDFSEFIEGLEQELASASMQKRVKGRAGAILVSVSDREQSTSVSSLNELAELARTAGVDVLDRIIQRRRPDPKTLLGKGKLEEIVLLSLRLGADLIIFDAELKPTQWRSITNATELKVIDRSMLILDIFAQRATSSEGRLQVELAQLKYNLPKLVEKDSGLSRLSGGIGGRGPGETKLEESRRVIRDRISELERRVQKLSDQRALRRQKRQESNFPVVAILGYTNVGKSTLFNTLTNSSVLAENKLFATLDPAHRRLRFPHKDNPQIDRNHPVILTDTVGFIRDLPKELVAAFKATLEVLHEADLFIHVLDAGDPEISDRRAAVEKILSDMGLSDVPTIMLLNKADTVAKELLSTLLTEHTATAASAINGKGLDDLLIKIESILYDNDGSVSHEASIDC